MFKSLQTFNYAMHELNATNSFLTFKDLDPLISQLMNNSTIT